MSKEKTKNNKTQKIDTITPMRKMTDSKADLPVQTKPVRQNPTNQFKMIDNRVPKRGVLWYIIFSVIFLAFSAFLIYIRDWVLLSFSMIFSVATLWRHNIGKEINITIDSESIVINNRKFFFYQIESWYFSMIGDDFTITFQLVKKYLPRLTYLFNDPKYIDQLRKNLGNKIPEMVPKEESYVDLIIRKLKI